MKLKTFVKKVDLINESELNKAKYILYYEKEINEANELTVSHIAETLENLGYAKINRNRLLGRIKKSKDFAKGKVNQHYKLSVKSYNELCKSIPLSKKSEEIESDESILPNILFENTRGYIEKICKQINGCYGINCFDACAVCMRRLLEVLLILTYQKHGKESEIENAPSDYKNLSSIINYTKSNNQFNLSKGTLNIMDEFRQLGNLSAHRIQYNCKKKEIDDVKREFRATVEELLYKSGLKK